MAAIGITLLCIFCAKSTIGAIYIVSHTHKAMQIVVLNVAIHRLDRLTSGVLILAKSLEITQQLEHQIRERQLKKKYLCRVMGEFSE